MTSDKICVLIELTEKRTCIQQMAMRELSKRRIFALEILNTNIDKILL